MTESIQCRQMKGGVHTTVLVVYILYKCLTCSLFSVQCFYCKIIQVVCLHLCINCLIKL